MFGDISDPTVAVQIGNVFGSAARDMRSRSERSVERETRGESPMMETSMTDMLVDEFASSLRQHLDSVASDLRARGVIAHLEVSACRPPGEHTHGADLGLNITIDTPTFIVEKSCLVQCKRMYSPASRPRFPEIRENGEEQARKMMEITPASFFMLYNYLPQVDLIRLAGVPSLLICPYGYGSGHVHGPEVVESDVWAQVGPLWDLGIAMLPASRVRALSRAAQGMARPFPVDANKILPGAWPLGVFIADILGGCLVGDTRDTVRSIANPRLSRPPPAGVHSPAAPPPQLGVRHVINFSVTHRAIPAAGDE